MEVKGFVVEGVIKVDNVRIYGIEESIIASGYPMQTETFNMNEKMLGNERGLTLKEWKSLINKAGGKLVEKTSFHYYKFYRRIFEVKKWLKPKAFWLFVIEKK